MLRLNLRELLPRAAFASCFAAICLGIVGASSFVPPQQHDLFGVRFGGGKSATPRCVSVMVHAYAKLDASGIWDCMSPKLQQALYTNSGLQGSAALEASLFAKYKDGGVSVEVTQYMHNPVCAPAGPAATADSCNAWVIYLTPIVAGIHVDTSATSLTIFINQDALIWALA